MVGHTGVMDATVTAVEATDVALGIVIDALEKRGGVALITADHGNAEFMADPATGQAHTAHTTYPVPLIIFDPSYKGKLKDGALFDVAPTFLGMLGIAKPAEMTGHDLRIPNSYILKTLARWARLVPTLRGTWSGTLFSASSRDYGILLLGEHCRRSRIPESRATRAE